MRSMAICIVKNSRTLPISKLHTGKQLTTFPKVYRVLFSLADGNTCIPFSQRRNLIFKIYTWISQLVREWV